MVDISPRVLALCLALALIAATCVCAALHCLDASVTSVLGALSGAIVALLRPATPVPTDANATNASTTPGAVALVALVSGGGLIGAIVGAAIHSV